MRESDGARTPRDDAAISVVAPDDAVDPLAGLDDGLEIAAAAPPATAPRVPPPSPPAPRPLSPGPPGTPAAPSEGPSAITRALAEVIEREKEKARLRIQELEKEFEREIVTLRRHAALLEEVNAAGEKIRQRVRMHLDLARRCRTMIRDMTRQIADECGAAGELGRGLEELRRKAAEETATLREDFRTRYGITLPFPDVTRGVEADAGAVRALERLREYGRGVEALEAGMNGVDSAENGAASPGNGKLPQGDGGSVRGVWAESTSGPEPPAASQTRPGPAHDGAPGPEPGSAPEAPSGPAPESDPGIAEAVTETATAPEKGSDVDTGTDDPPDSGAAVETAPAADAGILDDPAPVRTRTIARDTAADPFAPDPPEESVPELDDVPAGPSDDGGHSAGTARLALARLEGFRRTAPVPEDGGFRYFRNEGVQVLDGPSLLDRMAEGIQAAKVLHDRLSEARGAREQFMIKREIVELQDTLKAVVRAVIDFCAAGDCEMPGPAAGAFDLATLKSIADKLSIANWSDAFELTVFGHQVDTLAATMAPIFRSPDYALGVLSQLERRG